MKVNLVSLGCSKNLVDSEKILGALGTSGAALCTSPSESDVLIINTCGFIAPALEETEDEIQQMLQHSKNGKRLYVIGCAVNRYGDRLKEKYPGVTGWFRLEEIPNLLRSLGSGLCDSETRLLTTKGYAYLKVSEGCTNKCTYCTIPSIKGSYHSFEIDRLVRQGRDLVELGAQELILIGQDTTRYGKDLYGEPMLHVLLSKLAKIEGLVWLRLLYAHPKTITWEIIDEIEHNDRLCKYIDLPIQHISTRILNLMSRGTDQEHIERVLNRLKKITGMSIRTTIIVGFPTETDAEFEELMAFIDTGHFDWVGVFPYFPESGTKAAGFDQLPDRVVEQRYARALELQEKIIKTKNQGRINTQHKTLIHARHGSYIGHAMFGAPELDSHILVNTDDLGLGQFYDVRITGCKGYDLEADLLTEQTEAH